MKKTMKKIMLGVMSMTLVIGLSMSVMAKEKEKTCGKHATYSYDKKSKTLTIDGKGTAKWSSDWYGLKIEKIVINKGIKKIAKGFFDYNDELESVKLPEGLKVIGDCAFCGTDLKKINLPDSLEEIGNSAFENTKIKKIDLPNGLETIGKMAFSGSKLQEVVIPKSVKKIGFSAFSKTKLESVTVPKTVDDVGKFVFSNCEELKTAEWNYTSIPAGTFYRCKELTKIKTDAKLKEIGTEAFAHSSIKAFHMPDSVKQLGKYVFYNCDKLESVTVSKNVPAITRGTFQGTDSLSKLDIHNGVKTIGTKAFTFSGIKKVTLPNSITKVMPRAFANASNLTSIVLSDNMTRIYHDTFINCGSLENVTFGSKTTKIGENAFENCKLTNLVIPSQIQTIDYEAFKNAKCQNVTLKNGVRTVDYWAFVNNGVLKSISIPASVTKFRTNALSNCSKLTTITVDANNANYAVADNCLTSKDGRTLLIVPGSKSGSFEIPENITAFDQEAFTGCKDITEYKTTNNNNLTTINGMVCSKDGKKLLAVPQKISGRLTIPEGITTIGASSVHYSQASQIIIPNTVTIIDACAFEYCNNITEVVIPGSVYQIPEACFWECNNLRTVTLEEGISRIWRNGFYGCKSLRKVELPKSLTYIHKTAFENCPYGMKIYCKKNSLAMAYATKYYISYKII